MTKRSKLSMTVLLTLILSSVLLSACSSEKNTKVLPNLGQIRNICELATLKCTYHNVAKSTKSPGKGILHAFEKERKFWIDYQGEVEISYDTSKIKMTQDGQDIEITLPAPKLECSVVTDSWNEDSYITQSDQLIQKNPITAEDQKNAVNEAQAHMKNQVINDSSLLHTAAKQAEELIKNYIDKIGDATGVKYNVTFYSETVNEDNVTASFDPA